MLNQKLGYLMRSGPPDALDQMVANNYGAMVVQALVEKKRGLMTRRSRGGRLHQRAGRYLHPGCAAGGRSGFFC